MSDAKLTIVSGPGGLALYVNDTRVAGNKPWGGGKIVNEWIVPATEIAALLAPPSSGSPAAPATCGDGCPGCVACLGHLDDPETRPQRNVSTAARDTEKDGGGHG